MTYPKRVIFTTCLALLPVAAMAQSPCGQSESIEPGETVEQLAERCDVSVPDLLAANDVTNPDALADLGTLQLPQSEGDDVRDWLGDARNALKDAGDRIGEAAENAGRSASDYLSENPELNKDFVELGESLGVPGFESGPAEGVWLRSRFDPEGELHFQAAGLPGNEDVQLGWLDGEEFKLVETLTTNEQGRLFVQMPPPDALPENEDIQFVLRTEDSKLRLASDPVRR